MAHSCVDAVADTPTQPPVADTWLEMSGRRRRACALASVRRSNCTYGFPVCSFREDTGPKMQIRINGAAGGVGTFAVQIAKSFGTDVTGVCSTRNVDMVRAIGADRVVDHTQEDFTTSGQRYDLLFDAVGDHPLSACRRVLNPKGY
jgi:NADPH:quinone reductase-like Zn-dependent oxidoreductase